MNVGREKGRVVTDLITKNKPDTMLELGCYIGYSTILFASTLKQNGGTQFISFEREPGYANVARALVDLAGLSDIVRFVVGSSSKSLIAEYGAGRLSKADMIFLDHYKPAYVRDLKICESLGLVCEGTILAADNVVKPGNPAYLEYIRSTVDEKRTLLQILPHKYTDASALPKTTTENHKDNSEEEPELPGDPDLLYENHLVSGFEPSGVPDAIEISVCKGKAKSS